MDDNEKDGRVAGGVLLFVGALIFASSWNQIFSGDKTMLIIGAASIFLGIGSFIKPEFAEVVVHWFKGLQKAEQARVSQSQHKPKNSPQIGNVNGNVTIHFQKESKKDGEESS